MNMTAPGSSGDVVLSVRNLCVDYPAGQHRTLHAVRDVSFDIRSGETIGLVGESGSGKSSIGRAIIGLPRPTRGTVTVGGIEMTSLRGGAIRRLRTRMPLVFQDPASSLSPHHPISSIVAEPLVLAGVRDGRERARRVAELLEQVGLESAIGQKRRDELSGGQCQRVCIARALATEPRLLICDEPTSSLDVSVQAQIINLLEELQQQLRFGMLFISHNLAVTRKVAHRIMVVYLGRVCELGDTDLICRHPSHPYTRALLDAMPGRQLDADCGELAGEPPSPVNPPSGCPFRTRCPLAIERCAAEVPALLGLGPDREVACYRPVTAGANSALPRRTALSGADRHSARKARNWASRARCWPAASSGRNHRSRTISSMRRRRRAANASTEP